MIASSDEPVADVREGGQWSRRQRLKNDVIYALVRVALLLSQVTAKVLGTRRFLQLGNAIGAVACLALRRERTIALVQSATIFPHASVAERSAFVRRNFERLGYRLFEMLALLADRRLPPLPLTPRAAVFVREFVQKPEAVVLCALHLGPWERVAHALVAAGLPLTTLARRPYDPRFLPLYARLREAHGVRVVYRDQSASLREMVRVLRRKQILGAPMDLNSRVPQTMVPFLGRRAPAPIGPAKIALRERTRVVVAAVVPNAASGLELDIEEIDVDAVTAGVGQPEQKAQALTACIYQVFERRIRALPEEWPFMHARGFESAERLSDGEPAHCASAPLVSAPPSAVGTSALPATDSV